MTPLLVLAIAALVCSALAALQISRLHDKLAQMNELVRDMLRAGVSPEAEAIAEAFSRRHHRHRKGER